MVSEKGQSRLPLLLMVGGGLFLVWTLARLLGGGDSSEEDALALEQRCSFPACRAADNELPARGYEGQSVVADPDDADHIVVTDANMIAGTCSYHVTFDRGKEWEDGAFPLPDGYTGCRINGPSGGHVPMGNAVRGPSGAYYVTFGSAHQDDSRRESILVGVSDDGGRTWRMEVAAKPRLGWGYARPLMSVTAGPSGTDTVLVAFWECGGGEGRCPGAPFVRSDDGGRTFSAPTYVNDPIGGQNPSQPVMTPDGAIHVLYQIRYNDGIVDLVLSTSRDRGATWTKSLVDTQFAIGGNRGYDSAKLVVNPDNGEMYTAYGDARTGRQSIIFRKSTDGGTTWAAPVGISPDRGATPTRTPWLAVSPDGSRIDVAFYREPGDKRDDVFWAYSTNGGETFSVRQVNETPINREFGYVNEIGDWYPPGVSSTADAALVAWSDTDNADDLTNTVDVFVRRMQPPSAGTAGLGLPP